MIGPEVVRVPLYQRGEVVAHALIDAADAHLLARRWHLESSGYAYRCGSHGTSRLHREVLGLVRGDGLEADHINRDKLDCRRSNLRVATHAQNMQNVPARPGTSTHRGVSWDREAGMWAAYARISGKSRFIGRYASEARAAEAARAFREQHMPFSVEVAA